MHSHDGDEQKIRSYRGRRLRAGSQTECKALRAGEVGYICASIKQVSDARVGDTITMDADPAEEPLPGYKKVQSDGVLRHLSGGRRENMKVSRTRWKSCRSMMRRFTFEPETSACAGLRLPLRISWGFCTWRLSSGAFGARIRSGSWSQPRRASFTGWSEPTARVEMLQNPSNLPSVSGNRPHRGADGQGEHHDAEGLCRAASWSCARIQRGTMLRHGVYHGDARTAACMICRSTRLSIDFFDAAQNPRRAATASLDYEFDRLCNSRIWSSSIFCSTASWCDAFSMIVHRVRSLCAAAVLSAEKLKEIIPMHQFEVPIQAAIGQKVIARETVKAYAQGCYRQVLRRRYFAKEKAAGKAEGRQEADASVRYRRGAAGGFHRCAQI